MLRTAYRLGANLINARFRPKALIHPLFVVFYITNLCNLRCFYCEEFSADKNAGFLPHELTTDQVKLILRVLRKKFDFIYITGGEPYVRQDLEELIAYMKEIGFKRISLNTNAVTLDKKPGILKHLRDLIISLDSMDADRKDEIIRCKEGTAQKIFDNIRWAARLQKEYGFEISLNCVVAPHTISDAREVLAFALQEGIKVSLVPQNVNIHVHPEFKDNSDYQALIGELMDLKEQTGLISGTRHFYKNLLTLSPFSCYPNVVARVSAKGDLYWPCHPLQTLGGNLLKLGSYDKAVQEGIQKYGILNACQRQCQMRCYIESSLLLKHPLALVREFFSGRRAHGPLGNPLLQPQFSPEPNGSLTSAVLSPLPRSGES